MKETPLSEQLGHRRADYDLCLRNAIKRGHWAMATAVKEDGYDPRIDWKTLDEQGENLCGDM